MYKIIAEYMVIGMWGVSFSNTIFETNLENTMGAVQLVLSALGVIYLIVKIYNETSGQILDRERKRLENEKYLRELLEDEEDEDRG
jgi:uncharacterized membrane protein YqjE